MFPWIQSLGDIEADEMQRVFNMGVGLVLVVSPYYADSIRHQLCDFGFESWTIGAITPGVDGAKWA